MSNWSSLCFFQSFSICSERDLAPAFSPSFRVCVCHDRVCVCGGLHVQQHDPAMQARLVLKRTLRLQAAMLNAAGEPPVRAPPVARKTREMELPLPSEACLRARRTQREIWEQVKLSTKSESQLTLLPLAVPFPAKAMSAIVASPVRTIKKERLDVERPSSRPQALPQHAPRTKQLPKCSVHAPPKREPEPTSKYDESLMIWKLLEEIEQEKARKANAVQFAEIKAQNAAKRAPEDLANKVHAGSASLCHFQTCRTRCMLHTHNLGALIASRVRGARVPVSIRARPSANTRDGNTRDEGIELRNRS